MLERAVILSESEDNYTQEKCTRDCTYKDAGTKGHPESYRFITSTHRESSGAHLAGYQPQDW